MAQLRFTHRQSEQGSRKNSRGKLFCNSRQWDMVQLRADRVCVEIKADPANADSFGELLRLLLHGGPGTGKSHILSIVKDELSTGILQWKIGTDGVTIRNALLSNNT